MTRIIVNTVRTQTNDNVSFKDVISANYQKQWLDTHGIIKINKNTIDENVIIPLGTNGLTAGTVTVGVGYSVTVKGDWRIL